MTILMSKIISLGQEYSGSPHCFPVGNNSFMIQNNKSFIMWNEIAKYIFYIFFRLFDKTTRNKGM